jgi:hypothetical protein
MSTIGGELRQLQDVVWNITIVRVRRVNLVMGESFESIFYHWQYTAGTPSCVLAHSLAYISSIRYSCNTCIIGSSSAF